MSLTITFALIFQLLPTNLIPQTQALTTSFDFANSVDYELEDSSKMEVSSGSVSLTEPEETVEDVFSTYLYTGNGATQTIENGIDLAGKGGLVWHKARSSALSSQLYDTERGAGKYLISNSTTFQNTSTYLTDFNSNGFTLGYPGGSGGVNGN